MKYKVKKNAASIFAVMLVFAVSTVLFVLAGNLEGNGKWAANGAAVILLAAFLKLLSRYVLPEYVYILDKNFIKICKIMGKSSTLLANIPLYECICLKKSLDTEVSESYIYTANIFPKNVRTLIYESVGKKAAVTLEASDEFYKRLAELMPCKEV